MRAYINGDVLFFNVIEDLISYMIEKDITYPVDCCIGEDIYFTICF